MVEKIPHAIFCLKNLSRFSNTKTHYVLSVRVIQTLLCNIAHRHGKCICESMLGVIGYIESKILNNT